MNLCKHICMYVCMNVCIYVHVCTCIYVCMCICMYVFMNVCIHVIEHIYMYVCLYKTAEICHFLSLPGDWVEHARAAQGSEERLYAEQARHAYLLPDQRERETQDGHPTTLPEPHSAQRRILSSNVNIEGVILCLVL